MINFSYQLYSSLNFPPLSNTLDMLSHVGYQQVEGYSSLLTEQFDAYYLRELLNETNLKMATSHFDFEYVCKNPKRIIDIAKILHIDEIYISYLPEVSRPANAAGWEKFGLELAEIGKPFEDAGLALGWHNHTFEFVDIGITERPIDLLLLTNDYLTLELDVAWAVQASANPIELIERYSKRITAAHIKDIAPQNQNINEDGWADVGYGVLDWSLLLAILKTNGTKYFVVEHDNPSDDRRFAERSISFLQKL